MDFKIKYNSKLGGSIKIKYCESLNSEINENNILYVERLAHLDYIEQNKNSITQYAVGDVISCDNSEEDLSTSKGLFYLLTLSRQNHLLEIKADQNGLLPIYYVEKGDLIWVSSSFMFLSNTIEQKTENSEFYTEVALLYSQIGRSTFFKEIKRLDYGETIELNQKLTINRTHRFYDYFIKKPASFKASIDMIALKFIEVSKFYLDKPCAISLTGGFDGRTVTGCGHYHKSDFINFSYGKQGSGDVDNPMWLAKKLKLKYDLIELDKNYLESEYVECIRSYVKFSGGFNGFQSPQSLYYVKKISEKRKIIVTGYLGSEVLANPKVADEECTPQTVLDFIKYGISDKNYAYSLYPLLSELQIVESKDSITKTLKELGRYFDNMPGNLSKNQKFSVYCFENVYRNTFGVWAYNAMHYAKLRIPFIDKDFLDVITKTEVSQFYRNFLEENLRKRLVGQLLYPNILKKVWPEINKLNSSKGYPPKFLLSLMGTLRIAYRKKLKINTFKEQNDLDKLSTISGALLYINELNRKKEFEGPTKDLIIKIINTNALNRSLCFLSLTKHEFMRIIKQSTKQGG